MTMTSITENNLEIALKLAASGLFVHPCVGKVPQVKGWPDAATTDAKTIMGWWRKWPKALPGISTGKSKLIIVDCDVKNDINGIANFAAIAEECGIALVDVPFVTSPSGGRHYYFHEADQSAIVKNTVGKFAPGIDIRSVAGNIIAPGATLPNGSGYVAEGGLEGFLTLVQNGQLPPFPSHFVELLQKRPSESAIAGPSPAQGVSEGSVAPALSGKPEKIWAFGRLGVLCDELSKLTQGSRDNKLNEAAYEMGRYAGAGWVEAAYCERVLLEAANICGLVKEYGEAKTRGKIVRILNDGAKKPTSLVDPNSAFAKHAALVAMKEKIQLPSITSDKLSSIPPRAWIYGRHLIRGFVSATIAPGGSGKSALALGEAVAIAIGRDLLGSRIAESVPVWYHNGEDPVEETNRRLAGFLKHHRIDPKLVEDRLFITSGRNAPIRVAEQSRTGVIVLEPIIDRVKELIAERGIGLMVVDPFVTSHLVEENSNPAINVVLNAWAKIAEDTGCAIELVHHTRKGQFGQETSADDSRGAGAFSAAVRSLRVINRMTKEEAEKSGVPDEDRGRYFRLTNGKANLAPPSEKSEWFNIASVELENGTETRSGDSVGVVEPWLFPETSMMVEVSLEQVAQIQTMSQQRGMNREHPGSQDWLGHAVAEVLRLDVSEKRVKDAVRREIVRLVAAGHFVKDKAKDAARRERPVLLVGKPALPRSSA